MAKNPMQKKATNAFLLGMMLTLIIALLIGGAIYALVIMPKEQANKNASVKVAPKEVYVITQPVKSGEEIIVGLNAEKQKIETGLSTEDIINPIGAKAKIDLASGTIVTPSMLMAEEELTKDVRLVEYNMIALPVGLMVGDYIDIRFTLPSGQDYIVIAKKPVVSIMGETIALNLSEEEILMLNGAIVERYVMIGSNMYITKYVEPGTQGKATPTYQVNGNVKVLLEANPNIIVEARQNFRTKYNENLRQYINNEYSKYIESEKENIEAGIQEQIEKAKQAREQYLMGM